MTAIPGRGPAVGLDEGPWRDAVRRVAGDRAARIAFALLAIIALIALLAPMLAPYGPSEVFGIDTLKHQPPSVAHPFGTDGSSRDVLSRVLYGARVSLAISLLAVTIAATVGTLYGAIAGYCGGWVDASMMRLIDAMLAVPRVLLLIAIVTLWNRVGMTGLILTLGLTGWFGVSRLVRAQVMSIKEREFIASARALGAGHTRILLRHVLPHVVSPVLVAATLGIGNVIVIEAGLSFLGMGVQQPRASWGNIILDGYDVMAYAWWVSVFPGLALVLTVLAVHLLADALRDALDPRQLPAR